MKKIKVKVSSSAKAPVTAACTLSIVETLFPLTNAQEEAFEKDSKLNLLGVVANARVIAQDMPELKEELELLLSSHDASKYLPPEHYGYVWDISVKRLGIYPPTNAVQTAMRAAMLHHKMNNKHHLEWWEAHSTVEQMPDAHLAHYFADLVYSTQQNNNSLTDTVKNEIEGHLFNEHQVELLKRWTKLFPSLEF